jgi:hypothetical protein
MLPHAVGCEDTVAAGTADPVFVTMASSADASTEHPARIIAATITSFLMAPPTTSIYTVACCAKLTRPVLQLGSRQDRSNATARIVPGKLQTGNTTTSKRPLGSVVPSDIPGPSARDPAASWLCAPHLRRERRRINSLTQLRQSFRHSQPIRD